MFWAEIAACFVQIGSQVTKRCSWRMDERKGYLLIETFREYVMHHKNKISKKKHAAYVLSIFNQQREKEKKTRIKEVNFSQP